jgi:hypothetical protein
MSTFPIDDFIPEKGKRSGKKNNKQDSTNYNTADCMDMKEDIVNSLIHP